MQPGEMPMETLTPPDAKRSAVSRDDAIALYRWMLVVREFENTVATWCQKQIVPGIAALDKKRPGVRTIYGLIIRPRGRPRKYAVESQKFF
jgi:hypothetical protein